MLGSLIRSIWRSIRGRRTPHAPTADAGTLQSELRAALVALLHEPLAHPKTIDYEVVANLMAAASAAEYMVSRMLGARNLERRDALLDYALAQCRLTGLMLEFGVFRGASLRAIARRVAQEVHGFDSFEGLPQDWTYFQKQGRFSLQGQAPHFDEPNVRIHQGWFEQTLPEFLAQHAGPVRFVHIDCDVYASTRTVLDLLRPRLVSGSVVVFDEYLNYPGWREHEFKAFQEYVAAASIRYRYLGFASTDCAVAIQIE